MNASPSLSARPVQSPSPTDRTRLRAAVAAFLFLPAAVATGILTLASERASRCVTYGEQCTPGLPGWLFEWSAGLGAVALLAALAAPTVKARQAALAVQIFAEATALVVILSHA
ncbi:hypothetical protein [Streptomyces avidinii]|uniref:Uncharacterized protein n=1 Tax=Streptomyces avidinii TaxID=1895 RepID=A0ABS4KXL4_STRAV|nr:hypothetical protein [Streptomyces avidinii]MBP2034777.1 hypothetical protein [Streptomyces avidinii]GGY88798.1 hypothetical protein GCM10010343_12450 [Streptomyces avidinii]